MKTSKLSNSLKYLTQAYLGQVYISLSKKERGYSRCEFFKGKKIDVNSSNIYCHYQNNEAFVFICITCRYDIQIGIQDPCDDCIAAMRLYKRMRSQAHKKKDYPLASDPQNRNSFASWRQSELEKMTPEQMLEVSRSDYYCWCLDSLCGF